MVAALNIVASLILLVMEKHRDIAILKTMGASARSVTAIFMVQGLLIGLVGTVGRRARWDTRCRTSSIATSSSGCRSTSTRSRTCRSPCCRATSRSSSSAAVIICFVATIYPSRQAARLDPAQALRYE